MSVKLVTGNDPVQLYAAPAYGKPGGAVLVVNLDEAVTVYTDTDVTVTGQSDPLPPLGTIGFDGSRDVWASTLTPGVTALVSVIAGGTTWSPSATEIAAQIALQGINVVAASQIFVYDPSPGPGNLIASIANTSGFDPHGNNYLGGAVEYFTFPNGNVGAMQQTAGGLAWYFATSQAGPWTGIANLVQELVGTGDTPVPILSGGMGLGAGLSGGPAAMVFAAPSGDTSGTKDSQLLSYLFTHSTSAVSLLPGTYYVTQGQVSIGLGQRLHGNGATIKLVGGTAGPAVTLFSASGSSRFQTAEVHDVIIDGSSGPSNATGLQFGDVSQVVLANVRVQNFGGGTGVGIYGLNSGGTGYWAEQLHGQVYVVNCDQCLVLDGSGGTSFERMALDVWVSPNNSGFGVIMRNSAFTNNGRLAIRGNFGTGGAVLALESSASIGQSFQLDIGVECDATSGTGPKTISFAGSGNTIDAYGSMQFLQTGGGGIPWVASNPNGNLNYQGRIYGDSSLLQQVRTSQDWATISTGIPSGWTGSISLRHNWDNGDVTLEWSFTIASGTAVTDGQQILAAGALGSQYSPAVTKFLAAHIVSSGGLAAGVFGGPQVTAAGGVNYFGAAFTPSGSSASWAGQATYSNSI